MSNHWYVDRNATGTGSGNTPANARTNVASMVDASSVQFGDRVWVRRTYVASAGSAVAFKSGFDALSHSPIQIIGWPSANDPFFEERPAAGTSAGWDSDGATFAGVSYPITVCADNSAFNLTTDAFMMTNWGVVSSASTRFPSFASTFNFTFQRAGKITLVNVIPRDIVGVNDITVTASVGPGDVLVENNGNPVNVNRVTITASCVAPAVIDRGSNRIDDLHILSNSIGAILEDNTGQPSFIGTIRGVNFTDVWPITNAAGDNDSAGLVVGDYYGTGPARFQGRGDFGITVAASATATHSGVAATLIRVASSDNQQPQFANGKQTMGQVVSYINVTSGVPAHARLHFHTTRAGCVDLSRNAHLALAAPGGSVKYCTTVNSGIRPGSVGLWGGSSISAGSSWIMTASWTPTFTGTAQITARLPAISNVTTSYMFASPIIQVSSS